MREAGGLQEIYEAIERLGRKHDETMPYYGENNQLRMTGKHETASYDKFTWGVANRGKSVRIGNETIKQGCGYFEDRRPAANIDPYLACAKLTSAAIGDPHSHRENKTSNI